MKKISKGQRYVNVKSDVVIEIVGTDDTGRCTVATVQDDGRLVRQRSMLENDIHTESVTKAGQPWKSGYIPVNDWQKNFTERTNSMADVDITKLDDVELATYVAKKEAQMKLLKDEAEKAKKILKARTSGTGTRIYGEIAVIARVNHRFDPALARAVLSPAEYNAICITVPDSTIAKRVLGADSEQYKKCMKDNGYSLMVRPATDDDYAAVEYVESVQTYVEEGIVLDGPLLS